MTITGQDLREAFAGISQARCLYLTLARRAEKEGFPRLAEIFRAAAEPQTVEAWDRLRALGAILAAIDHLKTAIFGESAKFKEPAPVRIHSGR